MVTRRATRVAEREVRRTLARLTDFVIAYASGALNGRSYVDALRTQRRLVREYGEAQLALLHLTGGQLQ